ncbi:TIGR03619 family F420-dependent LLM class oxidoreductase [Actinopolymorpha alba]|uniref:TIGR03619 family F420-dependent LLM class oxidoreductase n=1 Tax=Actinopolymorpha alba TaxID=533267 RepID=UPI00036D13CD|nr:TIGR03619 family F420-dependent LLM class oxidoreductase [Actinopolymorpha alba]
MKLGLNIPNFGPGTDPDSLAGWVRFAADAGFDLAMMSDHVAVTPDVAAIYPPPFYEPFTTLAWLAGITEHIKLGTTVAILPYRNPLLTARIAANIDQFSAGRFILGVGVGWSEQEFASLHVPFKRRGAVTDEFLAAITTLWTNDIASHEGEFVSFRDVHTAPRPAQTPHPPIWIGGASPAALRRAVAFGDAWHPVNAPLDWLRNKGLPTLRAIAEAAGRPEPTLSPRIRLHLSSTSLDTDERRVGEGSVAQVLGDLEELADLGAEYVVLDTNPDHPSDRRPTNEDWAMLETIASRKAELTS